MDDIPRCATVKPTWKTSQFPAVKERVKEMQECTRLRRLERQKCTEKGIEEAKNYAKRSHELAMEIEQIHAGTFIERQDANEKDLSKMKEQAHEMIALADRVQGRTKGMAEEAVAMLEESAAKCAKSDS